MVFSLKKSITLDVQKIEFHGEIMGKEKSITPKKVDRGRMDKMLEFHRKSFQKLLKR